MHVYAGPRVRNFLIWYWVGGSIQLFILHRPEEIMMVMGTEFKYKIGVLTNHDNNCYQLLLR